MINGIQSNYGRQQPGFGSHFTGLEELVANSPKITGKVAKQMARYIRKEAPHDGFNVVIDLSDRLGIGEITGFARESGIRGVIAKHRHAVNNDMEFYRPVSNSFDLNNPVQALKDMAETSYIYIKDVVTKRNVKNTKTKIVRKELSK